MQTARRWAWKQPSIKESVIAHQPKLKSTENIEELRFIPKLRTCPQRASGSGTFKFNEGSGRPDLEIFEERMLT